MNYATIKYNDIANGTGVRTSLFVSGCRHHCPGCFNAEAWDFSFGSPFDDAVRKEILDSLEPAYIDGLTVLGGEPMEPENQPDLANFLEEVKRAYPDKTIWCYTGFTYPDDLAEGGRAHFACTDALLKQIDVLVDGRFIQAQADISLHFRGSANQRILDLPASRRAGNAVLLDL